jgi:DNA-binding response OmpR family regulator
MSGLRPARASVLVVEADPATARSLVDALEASGYRVWHAADGQEARSHFQRVLPDLVLLDLILPDMDGLVLCCLLKSVAEVPIIICTATQRRSDPFLALKLGADDFVRKPVDLDHLLARIEAVLRRSPPRVAPQNAAAVTPAGASNPGEVRVGELLVEPARRRASLGADPLTLTPTEFRLLSVLAARAETVLTRDELAQEVWGYADASNGRTIDVHVRRLRVKLTRGHVPAPSIVSVRGLGYRLTADETAISAA